MGDRAPIAGGCFCGAVRYQFPDGAAYNETICHCSICRRTTGAPFVAWFTVNRSDLQFVNGSLSYFHSTPTATRGFCNACGTQIAFEDSESPQEVDLTTGSLDRPELLPPTDHTFAANKVEWVQLCEGLPVHAAKRPR